jgi:LAS superfamily LD-carboxypeptidase LdcB
MEHKPTRKLLHDVIPSGIVFVVLGAFMMYQFMEINSLTKRITILTKETASSTMFLTEGIKNLSENFSSLSHETASISTTLSHTQQNVDTVSTKVGGVEQTVGTISSTVGTLQKLSEVDPELLKKYAKVYFMNENYVPAHLTTLPEDYTYNGTRQEQFLTESWSHLQDLFNAAKKDKITLYVKSGYRSFAEQKSLKSAYSVMYGAGTANAFSADQGYSEHQLGTTIDFITTGTGGQLNGFDKTAAYTWLLANAYRFGFVLSYPKGNTYYVYEPWHWRYIGVKLATYLHTNSLNFYDMDQREIDKYLVNTFD